MTATDHELGRELGKELHATVRAREALGPEYESALLDSFLDKATRGIDQRVEERVRGELARRGAGEGSGGPGGAVRRGWRRLGLPVVSLVLAIPLSAVAVVNAHFAGLALCWVGIVAVNAVHALAGRDRPAGNVRRSEWD